MGEKIRERLRFEQRVRDVLARPRSISNLLNKIKKDRDYAVGFYRELCKKSFLGRDLSNFFYNIIIYIEDLYFPNYAKSIRNRYKSF